MSFWIIACLMMLVAVSLTVWPLVREDRGEGARTRRAATVRALYRDRLTELDDEVAGGQLAPDARNEVAEELAAALLTDYSADPINTGAIEVRGGALPRVAVVLALLLPVFGFGLYLSVGEPTADRVIGAEALLALNPDTQRDQIAMWQAKLSQRVQTKPADAQSWYLLGHADLQLDEYQRAAEAFAMAHALHGKDPSIDVYWLQARYLASGGAIDVATRGIAERLLQR
ncbi:MAG: c-type cytochrome biogenesis protein CcmI, partial [Gammaproteobacteria bacterium]|nr:c-type cytochrome biogenesis protein CcmI [Gammaproteobacteria bacterium]